MNHQEYEAYHKKFAKCLEYRVSRFKAASTAAGKDQSIERTRLVALALDEHKKLLLSEHPIALNDLTEEERRAAMERAQGEDSWKWESEEFEKTAYHQAFSAYDILLKAREEPLASASAQFP